MRKESKTYFRCDKCGKEFGYNTNWHDEKDMESMVIYEQCWSYSANKTAGYGSKFDGSYVDFDICDDCLFDFIMSFKFKGDILNTGSNYGYENE